MTTYACRFVFGLRFGKHKMSYMVAAPCFRGAGFDAIIRCHVATLYGSPHSPLGQPFLLYGGPSRT